MGIQWETIEEVVVDCDDLEDVVMKVLVGKELLLEVEDSFSMKCKELFLEVVDLLCMFCKELYLGVVDSF